MNKFTNKFNLLTECGPTAFRNQSDLQQYEPNFAVLKYETQ